MKLRQMTFRERFDSLSMFFVVCFMLLFTPSKYMESYKKILILEIVFLLLPIVFISIMLMVFFVFFLYNNFIRKISRCNRKF